MIINPTHITDFLERNAASFNNRLAVDFENRQLSWEELWQQVQPASFYFGSKLGDKNQKIVALLITNSIEFIIVYLAVLRAGHIALLLDPVYKKLEIDAIIDRVSPDLVIFQDRYSEKISHSTAPLVKVDEVLHSRFTAVPNFRLPADKQVASLTFTSGTSGTPKIVPNTHANHIWNIKVCSQVWQWTAEDTLLINLPLSHMHGIVMGLSGAIYHGNTLYLRQQSFNAKEVLEDLASGKISLFTHGPLGYMKMLDQPGEYDLSKVRLFISGSAPFPPRLWQQFKKRFNIEVLETYGSSETGRIAANTAGHIKLGSPGQVLPGVDLKLSGDGEVMIKSGGLFPGYWMNPQATAAETTADGYWRTGDLGQLENGYLTLKGRVQERIRRFGYTVSPRDVEWALYKNPGVKEVHVMGVQSPDQPNDSLVYFLKTELKPSQISEYSAQNLPFAWRADKIVIMKDGIPRTTNGKPNVKELKVLAESAV